MVIKKSSIAPLGIITLSLASSLALAAVEGADPDASFAGWPLPLLIGLVLIFRKKIFSEVDQSIREAEGQDNQESSQEIGEPVDVKTTVQVKEPEPSEAVSAVNDSSGDKEQKISTPAVIDLSGDDQCQASTAKGTRCKRKTTLETISKVINNKKYQLTICAQHNNNKLKVFFGLIK